MSKTGMATIRGLCAAQGVAPCAQLPPELFRQFKDRIDIDFAFTNKTDFAADEPVSLDLFVKNVPSLLVKVFEVNTKTMYQTGLR